MRRKSDDSAPQVPTGWCLESWVRRLRHMASICIHPERAKELSDQADALEREAKRS